MSAVTITLTDICAGGNHLALSVSGDRTGTFRLLRDDLSEAITEEEAAAFLKVVCKLAKSGRTPAQARALLLSGVTVTV